MIIHKCNLCNYESRYKCRIKQHQTNKHNINVKWFYCDEDGIMGKQMIVIRWNPHSYKHPGEEKCKTRQDRLKQFIELKQALRKNPPEDKIHVYYMFYDQDNEHIVKNLPFTMVY